MSGRSDPQKVVIKNAHDDIREHNAHGERRVVDEHNAHGFREDNNHQVVAENEPQVNVRAHVQDEVKNLKGELEKMKKERELERMQFEKLGIENEQFKKDFEVQGLKSENALLKAQKQFGIDLKTLSNKKQKIEDELKIVEKEKYKLVEENKAVKVFQRDLDGLNNRNHQLQKENTKLKANEASARDELKVLRMQQKKSQTEIERINERSKQLETEKNKFENFYQTAKREKEELLQVKKKMEGQLNDLKEANKRLQNDNPVQKKVTTPAPVNHDIQPIDFSQMSIEDFISSGISMVLENTVFCEDYKKWVSELERKSF
ncbi:uncharacterized protein [Clytia hemisphaerica]|uniref:uncharacterized protein n=1 Tax=Clytia hemisphaerica TaxID=252671 RepID=UPI0034D42CD2